MRLLIISGASGAGKSSIAKMLVSRYSGKYELVKSVTTRTPRDDEDQEEYTFLSEDSFRILERAGNFLETTSYSGNGNIYATPRDEVTRILRQDKMPVLVIDVAGRKQVCNKAIEYDYEVTSVFIVASAEQVYKRLLNRGEDVESIINRMTASIEEAREGMDYDYIINNDDIDKSVEQIETVLAGEYLSGGKIPLQRYIADVPEIIQRLDNKDSVSSLMQRVEQFCTIRDWDRFNSPKDLAIGVSTEANELLDIFRFKTETQMESMFADQHYREHIGEELADTLFFLLRFCAHYGFNPGEILVDKIHKNAEKYPVALVKGKNLKKQEYTRSGTIEPHQE